MNISFYASDMYLKYDPIQTKSTYDSRNTLFYAYTHPEANNSMCLAQEVLSRGTEDGTSTTFSHLSPT